MIGGQRTALEFAIGCLRPMFRKVSKLPANFSNLLVWQCKATNDTPTSGPGKLPSLIYKDFHVAERSLI
jgi:hypothetical protein